MSTRCQIGFYQDSKHKLEEWEALIYRHCDGYPKAVLPDIKPILEDFNKNRGLSDVEYASAWLVAQLKENFLNIGICKDLHGDIEYYYAVSPDKIEVYETIRKFWDEPTFENMKLVKTINLKKSLLKE